MKILLTKDARIKHKAGEIVEVSPAEASFLLSVEAAVSVAASKPKTERKPRKK